MTLARLQQVKATIEDVGWTIVAPEDDIFEVFDNQIIWTIRYRESEVFTELIFQLVAAFGGRTERLADLLFFRVEGDSEHYYFYKIKTDDWKAVLSEFRRRISLIPPNS
ncbi:hypothetical protein [Xanthomonas medicagonis]|uniref:hypothetical protein n=1 Tax=Xanthomonas medicagonis TaxID=3160841 RepID=UPI003515925B